MEWSLYSGDKFLNPLKFSNGKNQFDIVKEVIEKINHGKKVVFIRGMCGSGKSAIALNVAKELGKTSVIVPIKNLQMQYKADYENGKYLLKPDKERLKISVITGRKNHECRYLKNNKNPFEEMKSEVNSKLSDIFDRGLNVLKKKVDASADNKNIPCRIDIKEKNWRRLREYLKENKDVDYKDFQNFKDVKRASVAGACPYWSPVISSEFEMGWESFKRAKKKKYIGLNDKEFVFYMRNSGCPFYEQFNSFVDSDVIVFNSMKYILETYLGRKPKTEVEIIDECDEFLDKLSNQKSIHLDRLQNSLIRFLAYGSGNEKAVDELLKIIKNIKRDPEIERASKSGEILELKKTGIYEILKVLLKNHRLVDEADEDSYVLEVEETALMFEDFFDDSYVIVSEKDESLVFSIVTTNLAKRFENLVEKNKCFILMSGTLHDSEVLKNIFGIENYEIINAEIQGQGSIKVMKTNREMDCSYSNLTRHESQRKGYLKALDKCVEMSDKPCLVHVQAFIDLPSENEKKNYQLKNLVSRESFKEEQDKDKKGIIIESFKKGKKDILFSTRASRGMDFPGDQCRSIVFTKYPNPNVKEAFWRILNKTNPEHYWIFYRDKARRELLQKVYRGLRSKNDSVFVLSPDIRVLDFFEKN